MPDGIRGTFRIDACVGDFKKIEKVTDRATMYGIRQAGRLVKQVAKRNARVYKGPARRWSVGGTKDEPHYPTLKGEYKKSISSSKRLKRDGDAYVVQVGPRGAHVHLYAPKLEKLDEAMAKGYAAALAQGREIFDKSWDTAIRKAQRR